MSEQLSFLGDALVLALGRELEARDELRSAEEQRRKIEEAITGVLVGIRAQPHAQWWRDDPRQYQNKARSTSPPSMSADGEVVGYFRGTVKSLFHADRPSMPVPDGPFWKIHVERRTYFVRRDDVQSVAVREGEPTSTA